MSLKQNILDDFEEKFVKEDGQIRGGDAIPTDIKNYFLSKLSLIEQEVMKKIDERKGVIFNNKDYYNKVFSGEDMHYVLLVLEERIKRLFN
jgi:hypothetical protein